MAYTIVGGGVAAARAAEAMRAAGYDGRITLITEEATPPYQRPPLSKEFLAQPADTADLWIHPQGFYEGQRVELRLGQRATGLDVVARAVRLANGETVRYERLLIATGTAPRRLAVEGAGLDGVAYLRTIDDAGLLARRIREAAHIVVAGGGLIGLEVAAAARALGKGVTLIEQGETPMQRVIGDGLGRVLADVQRDHGVDVRLATTITAIRGAGRVEEVVLSDGGAVACDLVVAGVGVRPCMSWLEGSGVALEDGVPVDEFSTTNVPGVFAAGDVARTQSALFGESLRLEQYGNAHSHGVAAGRSMVGQRSSHVAFPATSAALFGQRIQVVGLTRDADHTVVRGSEAERAFVALYLRRGRVVGAFGMNRPREVLAARRLIAAQAAPARERLADAALALDALG